MTRQDLRFNVRVGYKGAKETGDQDLQAQVHSRACIAGDHHDGLQGVLEFCWSSVGVGWIFLQIQEISQDQLSLRCKTINGTVLFIQFGALCRGARNERVGSLESGEGMLSQPSHDGGP